MSLLLMCTSLSKCLVMLLLTLLLVCSVSQGRSATHSHVGQAEREKDGARAPKDRNHFKDGQHHTEYDHEAILGSRRTAEDFDELPPEEAKRRLRELVVKMDTNEDGYVDSKELLAWLQVSMKYLSLEEADERFKEEDEDEDGRVTWKEHMMASFDNEDDLSPEDEKYLREDKLVWAACDKDGDGMLNEKEFSRFSLVEEDPELLDIALTHNLREKDKNKDGFLDFKEYLGSDASDKDKEYILTEKENFDEYDLDKDGLLSRKEASEWLYPSNQEMAKEETDHLIAEADEDGDNKLSYDEIVNNHELFVGSEATHYGDALHFVDEL